MDNNNSKINRSAGTPIPHNGEEQGNQKIENQ